PVTLILPTGRALLSTHPSTGPGYPARSRLTWSGVLACYLRLIRAGFRRYSTYWQAVLAGLATNVVFGFLLAHQLAWAVALLAAGRLVLARAVRKLVIQGG
ncbi:MAG: hypothetical protein ACRDTH_09715, partial [Pseudonocardiaceae bacterium]